MSRRKGKLGLGTLLLLMSFWIGAVADSGDIDWRPSEEVAYEFALVHMQAEPPDYQAAAELLEESSDAGYAKAQHELARLHMRGEGVLQNYERAIQLFKKAAEQGYAPAQQSLGSIYLSDRAPVQDVSRAVEWYRKAANQGEPSAQFMIAYWYYNGELLERDLIKSHMWANLAAAQGNKGGSSVRVLAERELNADEVVEAQRLAREWEPFRD